MPRVQRSAWVDRPAEHLFDLIEAAEHYPRFLPWCAAARIVHCDAVSVSADLEVRWHGLAFSMRTRNTKRRPGFMSIRLEQGPFHHFDGEWRLKPLGLQACRVDFLLDWALRDGAIAGLASRLGRGIFTRMADDLVDAFVARAEAMPLAAGPSPALGPENL